MRYHVTYRGRVVATLPTIEACEREARQRNFRQGRNYFGVGVSHAG